MAEMRLAARKTRSWLAGGLALVLACVAATPAMAATGVDVSSWQHHPGDTPIDWPAVRSDGHTFAFIKADEGPWSGRPSYYTNPYFASDWAAAGSAGMYRGAYHYAQPKAPAGTAVDDARHMISVTGTMRGPTDLPPVLDLEEHRGLSPSEIIAWTGAWLDEVERLTGRKAIIYTSRHFWEVHLADTHAFSDHPLWIASWFDHVGPETSPGRLPGGWSTWTFWQWTADGRSSGIEGQVDLNRYCCPDGNLAALANGATGDQASSNPFGHLDGISSHTAAVSIRGWAVDPDTRDPLKIHVWVDGHLYDEDVVADEPRGDIAVAYPGWGPHHGFDATVPMTRGRHEVCVYVLNEGPGSANIQLGCWTVDVPDGPLGFSDVQGWHPFVDEISWLHLEGLAEGYDDGTFRPAEPITRQAMAAFLARYAALAGHDLEPDVLVEFDDVPVGHPFHDEIAWMAANGIAEGYEGGAFRPEALITRQALAAFLSRLFEALGHDATASSDEPFSDVPVGHPFHDEIAWMAANGIAEGYEDGAFGTDRVVTRQATAAFVHRFDELLHDIGQMAGGS